MKAAVFSFNPPTPDGSLANARTAQWLADKLGIPLICGPEIEEQRDLDALFLVAGVFMYCRVLPQVAVAIEHAKHVFWVQNDYTIQPPLADGKAESPFRKAFRLRRMAGKPDTHFWTTMEKASQRTPLSAYLNWNSMAFEERLRTKNELLAALGKKTPAVFYYGADRAGRQIYFDRYFKGQEAPLVISSFSKSMMRYNDDATVIGAFPRSIFFDELNLFSMGLYLEDRKSHQEFTSPATRFYEMLSVGMAMVFQPEAAPMLKKAGYDVTPYLVQRPRDLSAMLSEAPGMALAQWQAWGTLPHHARLESAVLTEFDRVRKEIL